MRYIRFLPKAVTVCFKEKKEFDCKNNHNYGKLANFQLDNISKIHSRILVVLSYTLLRLGLKKV